MTQYLDEPYTRITNEILEEIAKRRFNGTQYGIIICILRNTYGFQRKSHRLSLSYISEATNSKKAQIKRELDKLIEMKVIKVYDEGDYTTSRDIGFNKYFSEWQLGDSTLIRVHPKKSTVPENEYGVYPNPSTGGVPYLGYQERKVFKETLKEISSSSEDERKITLGDTYTKFCGKIIMPENFRQFFKDVRRKGYDESFCIDLLTEAGDSAAGGKFGLNYLREIYESWHTQGFGSREEAKQKKEGDKRGKYSTSHEGNRPGGNQKESEYAFLDYQNRTGA